MQEENPANIIRFLKDNIEPIEDQGFGRGYRAAATLTDGTPLPCVVFRNAKHIVELAMQRFEAERKGKGIFAKSSGLGYQDVVKSFVAARTTVASYHLSGVGKSRFAFPGRVLREIKGETTMGWTAFVARFQDQRVLGFGTRWTTEFFDLPEGYDAADIIEIISGSYVLKTGAIAHHRDLKPGQWVTESGVILREKPFFECFLDDL